MSRDYSVVIERDREGYYVASVPSLPGAIRRRDRWMYSWSGLQEVIALYLEVEEIGDEELDFVGVQKVVVSM